MPIFELDETLLFPPVKYAEKNGLLAVGGDLSVARLHQAYLHGIFPWFDDDSPILWWSPDPRCVLFPEKLHIPSSMKRLLAKKPFEYTIDTVFEEVIRHCSISYRPDQDGTWITEEIIEAYIKMHAAGFAHSIEVWENEVLVGGLYGIAIGSAFFGESMFYLASNASKAAIIWATKLLQVSGFKIIDCQMQTDHMTRFGATLIMRKDFMKIISEAMEIPPKNNPWIR